MADMVESKDVPGGTGRFTAQKEDAKKQICQIQSSLTTGSFQKKRTQRFKAVGSEVMPGFYCLGRSSVLFA